VRSSFLVVLFVTAALGGFYVEFGTGDVNEVHVQDASEWCEQRDGDLVLSNVIGTHGGLHCHLPNGTAVHVRERGVS